MIPDGQLARYLHRAMIFGSASSVIVIVLMRYWSIPGPFLLTGSVLLSGVHLLCAEMAAKRINDRWTSAYRHRNR